MKLIATYNLTPTRILCVANVHFTSDHHRSCTEKRQQQMQDVAEVCPWAAADGRLVDVLVIGDTNMEEGESLPSDYADCGGSEPTYDPTRNALAGRISRSGRVARYDRMLLRRGIPSGGGTVWKCTGGQVIGREAVRVDGLGKEGGDTTDSGSGTAGSSLFLSDHYGLLCRFDFGASSPLDSVLIRSDPPVPTSAVVLLPPDSVTASLQAIRQLHDPAYVRWPPHINLLWGFVSESRLDDASTVLRGVCRDVAPFTMALGPLTVFRHRRTSTVYASVPDPHHHVRRLQTALQAAYPLCSQQSSHSEEGFTPHCTVAKLQSRVEPLMQSWSPAALAWTEQSFEVGEVVILSRRGDEPFQVYDRIPLTGKEEPPTTAFSSTLPAQRPARTEQQPAAETEERQHFDASTWAVDCVTNQHGDSAPDSVHQFLTERALLPSAETEQVRVQVVERVRSVCQSLILQACAVGPHDTTSPIPQVTHIIGSIALCTHLPTSDTDILVCGPSDFPSREFFNALRQRLETNPLQPTQGTADLSPCTVRLVLDALVPVAAIRCGDHTVDVQYARFPSHRSPLQWTPSSMTATDLKAMDPSSSRALCGLLDLLHIQRRIPPAIRPAFACSLRFIRYWASCRGLNDSRLGFLGGHSWSLMLTSTCEGVDEWMTGVRSEEVLRRFFERFAEWRWPRAVELEGSRRGRSPASVQVALMPILCPTAPHHNSARGVCRPTFNVLRREISRGADVLSSCPTESLPSAWSQLCQPSSFHLDYPLQLRLLMTADDAASLAEYVGVVEASVLGLVAELERLDVVAVPHKESTAPRDVKTSELFLGLCGRANEREEEVKAAAEAFGSRCRRSVTVPSSASITVSTISPSAEDISRRTTPYR